MGQPPSVINPSVVKFLLEKHLFSRTTEPITTKVGRSSNEDPVVKYGSIDGVNI